jgi:hypothetical protein
LATGDGSFLPLAVRTASGGQGSACSRGAAALRQSRRMRVLPDSAEPGEEEHGLNLAGGVSLLSLSASCGEQSLAAPRAATVKGQRNRTARTESALGPVATGHPAGRRRPHDDFRELVARPDPDLGGALNPGGVRAASPGRNGHRLGRPPLWRRAAIPGLKVGNLSRGLVFCERLGIRHEPL